MGKVLEKQSALFSRDEQGELVPQESEIVVDEDNLYYKDLKGKTIFVIPMTRGELKRFFIDISIEKDKVKNGELAEETDRDAEIVLKYVKQPKYTEEELKYMKGHMLSALVNTVFKESGVDLSGNKSKQKGMEEAEDEFSKN